MAHPGYGTTAKAAWRVVNPDRQREQATKHRRRGYYYKYGITYAEALAMRDAQGNRCLGCLVAMTDGRLCATKWNVDHFVDAAGRVIVRGILCTNCNKSIGLAGAGGHDPAALRRLAGYLEARGYVQRTVAFGRSGEERDKTDPQLNLPQLGQDPGREKEIN